MNKYKMIKPESDNCSFFGFFVALFLPSFLPSFFLSFFLSFTLAPYYIFYAMHFSGLNRSRVQGRKRECLYRSLLHRKAWAVEDGTGVRGTPLPEAEAPTEPTGENIPYNN